MNRNCKPGVTLEIEKFLSINGLRMVHDIDRGVLILYSVEFQLSAEYEYDVATETFNSGHPVAIRKQLQTEFLKSYDTVAMHYNSNLKWLKKHTSITDKRERSLIALTLKD